MMPISLQVLLLMTTTLYQAIATWFDDRLPPPGQLIDMGDRRLHLYMAGAGSSTIVVDHSLGGIEGYFLIEALSKLGRVCIYDRAGYGWSDPSPHPRTSQQIAQELDILLTRAELEPPYILVGDSFGSYNVRLYAHLFPQKVTGLVLTDGLHESGMLTMSIPLKLLKLIFIAGFGLSIFGSLVGIVRLLKVLGAFEFLKPELRHMPQTSLQWVKRSLSRPSHWMTMFRELIDLDKSGRQVSAAQSLGTIPIVSIKANSFFKPAFWTLFIPLKSANQLREQMHIELSHLSTDFTQVEASQSSHFVWIDQPEIIVDAVKAVLDKVNFNPNTDVAS